LVCTQVQETKAASQQQIYDGGDVYRIKEKKKEGKRERERVEIRLDKKRIPIQQRAYSSCILFFFFFWSN
jgi:hypothetical protein